MKINLVFNGQNSKICNSVSMQKAPLQRAAYQDWRNTQMDAACPFWVWGVDFFSDAEKFYRVFYHFGCLTVVVRFKRHVVKIKIQTTTTVINVKNSLSVHSIKK